MSDYKYMKKYQKYKFLYNNLKYGGFYPTVPSHYDTDENICIRSCHDEVHQNRKSTKHRRDCVRRCHDEKRHRRRDRNIQREEKLRILEQQKQQRRQIQQRIQQLGPMAPPPLQRQGQVNQSQQARTQRYGLVQRTPTGTTGR
jgi:hypothetical protein